MAAQTPLFGRDEPGIDGAFASIERIDLREGAWVELARGWLRGHATVFDELRDGVAWRSEERRMYDRQVEVPRQIGSLEAGDARFPVIEAMRAALDARYAARFVRTGLALYRDGSDSVAWHGDYVARRMEQALVATVSVGAPRRFLLRPATGGASLAFTLGWGDLIVMGGSCQRTYRHCIPKVARAEPRIAIMFRPTWKEPKT